MNIPPDPKTEIESTTEIQGDRYRLIFRAGGITVLDQRNARHHRNTRLSERHIDVMCNALLDHHLEVVA